MSEDTYTTNDASSTFTTPNGEFVPHVATHTTSTNITAPDTRSNRARNALIALAVAVGVLTLVATTFGVLYFGARGEVETLQVDKTNLESQLASTNGELESTRNSAQTWEGVADSWRLCGGALLETLGNVASSDYLSGLTTLGEAESKCEEARRAHDAASGSTV